MADRFKHYVESHREDFEYHQHDFEHLWSGIDQQLSKNRGSVWATWIRAAAVLLVLVLAAGITISNQMSDQMPQELAETEEHYNRLIHFKMAEVAVYRSEVDAGIWNDLELLDQAYLELKNDLNQRFDQEEVAQAMIDNQRAKLEILEHILNEIESKIDEDEVESLGL